MTRLAIRALLAKRLRLFVTVVTITLGVGFTTGTMILADTTKSAVSSAITDISDGVDVVVRGAELPDGAPRASVPADVVTTVQAVDGVAAAKPYQEGYTDVIGADGKVLDVSAGVGMSWIDDPALSLFSLVEGRAPGRGQVVLDQETADRAAVGVGDRVRLVTAAGPQAATVSGLARIESETSFGTTSFTLYDPAEAGAAVGADGPSEVLVRGAADPAVLRDAVAAALRGRDGLEVATGATMVAEQQDQADEVLGIFSGVLMAFGVIALVVGAMTIANTFAVTTAQRTQELALLRAVGATRGQVLRSVLLEAAALGALASALGLAAGFGVAEGLPAALGAAGLELPTGDTQLTVATLLAALAAGIGVTVVAAVVPAGRATRIPPVAALRESAVEEPSMSRLRIWAGAVALAGVALLIAGALSSDQPAPAGAAAVLALVASALLGPVALRTISHLVAPPLGRVLPTAGLGAANVARGARRSAATAMALAVGVALVSGASLFAATAGQSIKGDIADTIAADRVVRAAGSAPGLPPEVARAADDVRGVTAVALRSAPTRLGGENVTVTGTRLGDSVLAIDVETGRLPSRPGEVAIAADLAARTGWDVGARLPLTTPDGRGEARVTATFAGTDALSDVLATPATVNGLGAANLHDAVLLDGAAANLREVERALADQPTAVVETVDEYAASTAGPLNAVLSLVLGLLGVAVLVAVLGIATTVGLSVHERTRELGGLRAIGMERRQLRRAIRSEAVLVALVGAGVGLVIGLGATLTALEAMGDLGSPVLPGPALAATLIGAVLAGTLAAAAPARRAARMPVLDAMRA